MFIAPLFILSPKGKQPKYLSVKKMNKKIVVFPYTRGGNEG